MSSAGTCRSCGAALGRPLLDLGMMPLANSYVAPADLDRPEPYYPLQLFLCERCWLVQLPEIVSPERIFADYAYFSSYSDSWLQHARDYSAMAIERFGLGPSSRVVEVASNDGYLLRNFVEAGIPVLGVEPARNVAEVAQAAGIPTVTQFFGTTTAVSLAATGQTADLLVGNNVLAHVPDLNDFVAGIEILLEPRGVATLEFPHLLQLLDNNQFDTIYHEHFSYFSLLAVERVVARHGLTIWDVDELPTHGGSLRIYVKHDEDRSRAVSPRVAALRDRERAAGLETTAPYHAFANRVRRLRGDVLEFFIHAAREGKHVAGYGAPAKGNTLLNYCGIRSDYLEFTVDRSPHKQGSYLPGSRIPILAPSALEEAKPDYVCILPWNLKDEITRQLSYVLAWGGRLVVLIPAVLIL